MSSNGLLAYALSQRLPKELPVFHLQQLAGVHGPLAEISAICFLLCPPLYKDGVNTGSFIYVTLPRLLPQLTRTSFRQHVEVNAGIRGRVDWASTMKSRLAAGGNPAVFISQENYRQFDLPENQLLKYLLFQIQACLQRVPRELYRWRAWSLPNPSRPPVLLHLGAELENIGYWLGRHWRHSSLWEVSLPAMVTAQHLAAARRSKNGMYTELIDLVNLYRSIVEVNDWRCWVSALRQTAPLPPEVDDTTRRYLIGGKE